MEVAVPFTLFLIFVGIMIASAAPVVALTIGDILKSHTHNPSLGDKSPSLTMSAMSSSFGAY
jgi:hypothetical protein